MLKLEVGKKYVDRRGEIVGPFSYDKDTGAFILEDVENAEINNWWFPTGRFLMNKESIHDLVSVYKDKAKWLKEGEYYDYIKMPPNGARLRSRCVNITGDKAIMQVWRKRHLANAMLDLDDFYTVVVNADNEAGSFRPIIDFPPAVEEQEELEAIRVPGEQLF